MPRWAGALTWRCGSAVGKERGATAMMEFGVLGPLEVRAGSGLVRVPGVKERALLADLVVNAGRVVAADRLGEALWGRGPTGEPGQYLAGAGVGVAALVGPGGVGVGGDPPAGLSAGGGPRAGGRGPLRAAGRPGGGGGGGGRGVGGGAGVVAGAGAGRVRRPALGAGRGGPVGRAAP